MKKYVDIFIVNGFALTIAVPLYFFLNNSETLIQAIIAMGISVSFGIRKYHIENDKIFKELFICFNERYNDLSETLMLIENNFKKSKEENKEYQLNCLEKKKVIAYLNLCAEEYMWGTKKRIDKVAWLSWQKGMLYYLKLKPINEVVISEMSQEDSYYKFMDFLKEKKII